MIILVQRMLFTLLVNFLPLPYFIFVVLIFKIFDIYIYFIIIKIVFFFNGDQINDRIDCKLAFTFFRTILLFLGRARSKMLFLILLRKQNIVLGPPLHVRCLFGCCLLAKREDNLLVMMWLLLDFWKVFNEWICLFIFFRCGGLNLWPLD